MRQTIGPELPKAVCLGARQDFVSGHLSGGVGAESHAVENELRVKGAST